MDPISDFLTIIRNASNARNQVCRAQQSKMKQAIAQILKDEGYITDWKVDKDERGHPVLEVALKYVDGTPAVKGIKRVSKPGRRIYHRWDAIPRTLGGMGIGILTTSKGLMKDREARRNRLGGEMVCTIW